MIIIPTIRPTINIKLIIILLFIKNSMTLTIIIVLPIIIMGYMSSNVMVDVSNLIVIKDLFINNGWNMITAICMIIFIVFHFPCSTTMITIYKETKSMRWTLLSFMIPLFIGIRLCLFVNLISLIFV